MKSAIKTVKNKIRGLKIELKIWSDSRNFNQRILNKINIEIKEHEQAL